MTKALPRIARRRLLVGAGALLLVGPAALSAPPARRTLSATDRRLVMHRNPGCGCCTQWADVVRKAGFTVNSVDNPDLMAFKRKAGVPDGLMSCHTTVAGHYVIEGHVPVEAIRKLLLQKPKLRGIGVAGMPIGSPGMEVPGMASEPFTVQAFDTAGRLSVFR